MGIREIIEDCRRKQQQKPGQLEIPELMAIYEGQSAFMRTLRAATDEIPWASEHEALQEWRSRTIPDWGFPRDWITV